MEQETTTLPHSRSVKKIPHFSFFEFFLPAFSSPFFYVPFLLKIASSFLFASSFATNLFIPFIQYFITNPFDNPYQHFVDIGATNSFPYPFGMLAVLSPFFALFSFFGEGVQTSITNADLLVLRVPLLLADFGILLILLSWFRRFQKEVILLYWMSPILFYISYIHGQLDVIPMFFLFSFLYFLTKGYDYLAFTLLGFAIATKVGMVIIVPFVLFYLLKERKGIYFSVVKMTVPFSIFFLLNAHVIFTEGFVDMVFRTKEGFKVFNLIVPYNLQLVLYVVPCIVLLLLFRFAMLKRYSRNVLMVFLGFSFFILLLCIPPRQGWFFWVIPFAVYFYVQKPWRSWLPFHLLSVAYFVYFAFIPESDFFSVTTLSFPTFASLPNIYAFGESAGFPMRMFTSAAFTLLQGVLLLNIYVIYKNGVTLYVKHKLYYKTFLVGIAGDSGSGKTTFAELLGGVFSKANTTVIAGDDMHKWERGNDMWQNYTHLDPLANELHADIKNVYTVKHGSSITRKQYDHKTGTFTNPKVYKAKRLVIFEGLHVFFLDKVRKAFDLKIYVAPEDQLRLHWKIIRDAEKRGYTKEQTLAILEKRKDDSEKYITVQEKHSDIVISLRNDCSLGGLLGEKDTFLSLSLFITCANDIFLQPLFDELSTYFSIDYLICDDKQRIKFTGTINEDEIQYIAEKILPELDDISSKERVWASGYQGVMQLFTAFYMFQVLTLEDYDY